MRKTGYPLRKQLIYRVLGFVMLSVVAHGLLIATLPEWVKVNFATASNRKSFLNVSLIKFGKPQTSMAYKTALKKITQKQSTPVRHLVRKTKNSTVKKILPVHSVHIKNKVILPIPSVKKKTVSVSKTANVKVAIKKILPPLPQNNARRPHLQARPTSGHKPRYPVSAIRRFQQGRVVVELNVDTLGRSKNIKLLSSSGYYLLDQSVLNFVQQERFIPAKQNGNLIVSQQIFSFVFILR